MGIFHAVQYNVKNAACGGLGQRQRILGDPIGHHALMRHRSGRPVELGPRFKTKRHLALMAQRDQLCDTRPLRLLGNQNAVNGAAGAKSFTDGMDSY